MYKNIIQLMFLIGFVWGNNYPISKEKIIQRVKSLREIGEYEGAISLLKGFIIENSEHENWEIKLKLAELYKDNGNTVKRKIIYANILKNNEVPPDSIVNKCSNRYSWILGKEFEKTKPNLDNSIRNLNSKESFKLSDDLMNIVREMPNNNKTIRKKLESVDGSDFYKYQDWTSRIRYMDAIVLKTVTKKLFSKSYYFYSNDLGDLPNTNPPSDEEITDYKNKPYVEYLGNNIELFVIKDLVLERIVKQFESYASDFGDLKNWEYSGKCYGFAKDYCLEMVNSIFQKNKKKNWSYGCVLNAYNEAVAYRNNSDYRKALELFEYLELSVPNVDEWMIKKDKRIWELYKRMDPNIGDYVHDTKSVAQHIMNLKTLLNN